MPNIHLGISVPSTVVIVFYFYYMDFFIRVATEPSPLRDTVLGV